MNLNSYVITYEKNPYVKSICNICM